MKPPFLLALFSLLAACFLAPRAIAGQSRLAGDGKIAIYSYHEGEYLEISYREGRNYRPDALKKLSHAMRSRGDGAERAIAVRLIELLDHLQDRFGAETVEIVSGYRSPSHNRSLALEGHAVARESLHMLGQAADIHMDEVREEDLFAYIKGLGMGGAGLYPRFDFVHVDVGSPRSWQEAAPKERVLIGTENNPNPAWAAVTGKDIYSRGETLLLTIANSDYRDRTLVKNIWIERFRRGDWCDETRLERSPAKSALPPGGSAEYEWRIPNDQPHGKYRLVIFTSRDFSVPPAYSNEFYVKRPRD